MSGGYNYHHDLDVFTQYHVDQERQHTSIGPALPALGHALSGSTGSAISKLLLYPLDLLTARLQVQRQLRSKDSSPSHNLAEFADAEYKDLVDAAQKIYNDEGGIKAFYSGVWEDTAKSVADSFLFFLAYTFLRENRKNKKGGRLSTMDEVGVGMVAGAFSKFLTTPISQIVTRKQTAAMVAARSPGSSLSPKLSAKDIALQIRDEKGYQGFWSGYSASLVLTLNPALTMMFHESLLRLLVPASKRSHPSGKMTFLLAALSKAIASTIMYPFSLAKTRAQMSSKKPTTSEPHIHTDKDTVDEAVEKAKIKVKRNTIENTIFGAILNIARTEGIEGLYHGLSGEILRGFFSHGITMLVKEKVHAMVIQLYYMILRALKRFPGQVSAAKDAASEKASNAVSATKDAASSAGQKVVDAKDAVSETTANVYHGTKDAVTGAASTVSEKTSEAASSVKDGVSGAASTVSEKTADAVTGTKDAVSNVASTVGEKTSQAASSAKDSAVSAGQTVSNATSTVGNKTAEVAVGAKDTAVSGAAAVGNTTVSAASAAKGTASSAASKVGDVAGAGVEKTADAGRSVRQAAGDALIKSGKAIGGDEARVPAEDTYGKVDGDVSHPLDSIPKDEE